MMECELCRMDSENLMNMLIGGKVRALCGNCIHDLNNAFTVGGECGICGKSLNKRNRDALFVNFTKEDDYCKKCIKEMMK